jgi:hypothetical protein
LGTLTGYLPDRRSLTCDSTVEELDRLELARGAIRRPGRAAFADGAEAKARLSSLRDETGKGTATWPRQWCLPVM